MHFWSLMTRINHVEKSESMLRNLQKWMGDCPKFLHFLFEFVKYKKFLKNLFELLNQIHINFQKLERIITHQSQIIFM